RPRVPDGRSPGLGLGPGVAGRPAPRVGRDRAADPADPPPGSTGRGPRGRLGPALTLPDEEDPAVRAGFSEEGPEAQRYGAGSTARGSRPARYTSSNHRPQSGREPSTSVNPYSRARPHDASARPRQRLTSGSAASAATARPTYRGVSESAKC